MGGDPSASTEAPQPSPGASNQPPTVASNQPSDGAPASPPNGASAQPSTTVSNQAQTNAISTTTRDQPGSEVTTAGASL